MMNTSKPESRSNEIDGSNTFECAMGALSGSTSSEPPHGLKMGNELESTKDSGFNHDARNGAGMTRFDEHDAKREKKKGQSGVHRPRSESAQN
jgi:hypothetical protein